jgi:hypothetical protein
MIFHFLNKFPQLHSYWDKYSAYQKCIEVQAKTILLEEGKIAKHYVIAEVILFFDICPYIILK